METIIFNEETHRYFMGGKELYGITGMIKKMLFPELYNDVPKEVLDNAAARGTMLHKAFEAIAMQENYWVEKEYLELAKSFMDYSRDKLFDYVELKVTDFDYFASAIDLVDVAGNLYDIKTTSSFNREYVQWQLSIYAYMYEKTISKPVGKLYAIWCTGNEVKEIEVERIEEKHVIELMQTYKRYCELITDDDAIGADEVLMTYKNPMKQLSETEQAKMDKWADIERQIVEFKNKLDEMKIQSDELSKHFMSVMQERGIKSLESDNLKITYKDGYERSTVDSKKLKELDVELYNQCLKTSYVNPSLIIKTK